MALPAGLFIGKAVQYLPNIYDGGTWNQGQQGPVAAMITAIDTDNDLISLVVFPKGAGPFFRDEIPYYTDAADDQNGFKLDTDTLTCTDENTGVSVTNADPGNFVIEFTAPAGSHGYLLFYKVHTDVTWLTPNQPGNASAVYEDGAATLSGLVDGTNYDFKLQNICNNGIASAGVVINETAVSPP